MSRVLDLWTGMTGTVLDFAGAVAPTGWLLCYGQSLLRADYPNLFAAIGTTYGTVDATHFTMPDCRGRAAAGKDNMGGAAANRLTNAGVGNSGINGSSLGATGGEDRHVITTNEMASHSHNINNVGTGAAGTGTGGVLFSANNVNNPVAVIDVIGNSHAHNNVQPTIVFNKIIKV